MKRNHSLKSIALLVFAAALSFGACKNNAKTTTTSTDTTTTSTRVDTPATVQAPVQVSADDSLTTGLRDATKDYPGVQATASNGEVTLTGTIKRSQLQNLMQSVQSLHPKKVNNNLTIQ